MEFLSPILGNGREKEESKLVERLEDTIFIRSQNAMIRLMHHQKENCNPILSTPEFPPENNETIYNDSLTSLDLITQTIPSLKILEVESITKDLDFKPFWNNSSKEISNTLWSPIPIDSPDWDLTSFNGCLNNLEPTYRQYNHQKEKPEKNLLTTSWKFLQSFQPDTMGQEITSIVTRKVKVFPTERQKRLFNKCFGTHRYFYNKAIEAINKRYNQRLEEFKSSPTCIHNCQSVKLENSFSCLKHQNKAIPWKLDISLISLRKEILKSDKELKGSDEEWQCEIPYDTRQLAIKDAVAAYKAAISNKLRGNIKGFSMGYKSRKMVSQIFWVDSGAIKTKDSKIQIFPSRLGEEKMLRVRRRQSKKLPEIFSDCKLYRYGNDFYLIYTIKKDNLYSNDSKIPIVSLDPGVRSFQTGYSPSGIIFKVGEKQAEILKRLHDRLDKLRSKRSKAVGRTKQRLRKRCLAIESKIQGVIQNLHNQTASYLARNYETIILPTFGTSNMQKANSLSSHTKRNLWTLRHYTFQQKLIGMCKQHNTTLYLVKEDYTTKTCGCCGTLANVENAKVFNCENCGYTMDRDVNGARNILLKQLTQYRKLEV
jgi:putative transposase